MQGYYRHGSGNIEPRCSAQNYNFTFYIHETHVRVRKLYMSSRFMMYHEKKVHKKGFVYTSLWEEEVMFYHQYIHIFVNMVNNIHFPVQSSSSEVQRKLSRFSQPNWWFCIHLISQ